MDNSRDSKGGGNAPLHIGSGVVGGSTGGASEADLARGYSSLGDGEPRYFKPDPAERETIGESSDPSDMKPEPGFLDRPHGWER